MIERKIVGSKAVNFGITQFIKSELKDVAVKEITFEKTPAGERITIFTSTPGLVIGREGSNIKKLTRDLKKEFGFDNPQFKIGEIDNPYLSASIVAKMIANDLARFGSQKFKLTGFKSLMNIMNSGAMGVEIRISGKLPSSRAKSWRFHKGYLKKTGYVSDFLVDKAIESVTLKTGVVGIKVSIMLPGTPLPDKIEYLDTANTPVEGEAAAIAEKQEVKETESKKSESDNAKASVEVKEEWKKLKFWKKSQKN